MAEKKGPVQDVRNVTLEEKLDKLTSHVESQVRLQESQNRAWERCLKLLTELNTILVSKWQSQDILLEEHPTVRGPGPTTVGQAHQPQPFSNYSDSTPYGHELEEERAGPAQSFPASAAAPNVSQEQVVAQKRPGPARRQVTSKAEILEQVEKRDTP
jgi:hypothetical protein